MRLLRPWDVSAERFLLVASNHAAKHAPVPPLNGDDALRNPSSLLLVPRSIPAALQARNRARTISLSGGNRTLLRMAAARVAEGRLRRMIPLRLLPRRHQEPPAMMAVALQKRNQTKRSHASKAVVLRRNSQQRLFRPWMIAARQRSFRPRTPVKTIAALPNSHKLSPRPPRNRQHTLQTSKDSSTEPNMSSSASPE